MIKYDIKCTRCDEVEEVMKHATDPTPACSTCGGETKIIIRPSKFVLMGEGWSGKDAKDDYAIEKMLGRK